MAARKKTPPPACLDCQHLLAELTKVERQQRKQAAQLKEYEALFQMRQRETETAQNAAGALGRDLLGYARLIRQQRHRLVLSEQHLATRAAALHTMPGTLIKIYPN